MASLRDALAQILVSRLAALPGWTALRGGRDQASNAGVLALVHQISESKQAANTHFYACSLRLGVIVRSGAELASASLDGGNPQRYLDRLVADVERAVHSSPWPSETIVNIEGHEVAPPSESSVVEALVTVRCDYRHAFDDPDSITLDYVDG